MNRKELEAKLNDIYCHFYPSTQQEILAEFDRLTEENKRLNVGNAYLLLQLERICAPLRKFSIDELRRHNPYLPHDDAEHRTLWSVIECICDYLDSQGR